MAAWPIVCMLLFLQLPAKRALVWSVLGGLLLLPAGVQFDLSGLPDLGKEQMIAIGVGVGTLMFSRSVGRVGGTVLVAVLVAVLVLSPFATALTNADPIVTPYFFLPAMTLYDGLSVIGANILMIVPFWAGRRLLSDEAGHREILLAVLIGMVFYSVLVLLEIRISPQLQRWIYGSTVGGFEQQVRAGGFRATVFLSHGLVVALFLGLALLAAMALRRRGRPVLSVPPRAWALYLLLVLLLQKSLGATVLAILFGGLMVLFSPKRQVSIAAIVALVIVSYPMLRGAHWVPVETIRSITQDFSAERSESLNTRLDNEERLLAKAEQRPLWGWGTWARNRIYDNQIGRDVTITDGTWIIIIGSFGWVGYIATFGLLTFPLIRLRHQVAKRGPPAWSTAGVAFLLAYNLCDLIPNSGLTALTWLMAGALVGHVIPGRRRPVEDGAGPPDALVDSSQVGHPVAAA